MVDARTPVIVGVGQSAENIGDTSYRGMSSVELAALSDTGVDTAAASGSSRFPDGRPRRWASRTTTRGRLRSVSALTPRARSSSRSAGRGRSIWSPSSRARSPPAAAAW